MDKKTEKMIALAVAYGINCKFCMEYHRQKAVEIGLTPQEMRAAIEVAETVKTGAARKTRGYADELFADTAAEPCCPPGSACCPGASSAQSPEAGKCTPSSAPDCGA